MTANRVFSDPRTQSRKADGTVNSAGKIYFREPGSNTTTLKSVYSDPALSVAYTNPLILDSEGRLPTIYMNGDYNVQMTDSLGSQLWRVDNYQPVVESEQYGDWSAGLTYDVNDIVRYTDGDYYVSLQSGSLGNAPSSVSKYWSQTYLLTVYNSSFSYSEKDVVYYDGNIYTSLSNSNAGNTPDTSFDDWQKPGSSIPPVDNFVGATNKYIYSAGTFDDLAIDAFPDSQFYTVGPTGSGADYIWTAMDNIPSTAVFIEIQTTVNIAATTGTDSRRTATVSFREDSNIYTRSATCECFGGGTVNCYNSIYPSFSLALGGDNTFEARRILSADADALDSVDIRLTAINFYTG